MRSGMRQKVLPIDALIPKPHRLGSAFVAMVNTVVVPEALHYSRPAYIPAIPPIVC
jgi:hypothetical protein